MGKQSGTTRVVLLFESRPLQSGKGRLFLFNNKKGKQRNEKTISYIALLERAAYNEVER